MSINIGPAAAEEMRPRITVVGIGGAGGNAVANMIEAAIEGVDFITANTDAQALAASAAERRIQLGPDITGGLGAGAKPEVGKAAAEETVQEIEDALEGVNMVFIAAGMGGGTGTGAAPVIAEAARRKGVLTVGVVTKPFLFEGTRRMRAAEAGIEELQRHVDTLIVIPNQNLFLVAKAETTFKEAFQLADEVLQQGVRSITDLMVMPGLINLDFADVSSVMSEMGKAMMGTGEAEGENRALDAAESAIANPLLDGVSMQGAKGVIISIIGGEDMKLLEVDEAANHIRELVDEDANIIWGSAFNPDLDGKIRVSVVATGIEQDAAFGHDEAAPVSLASPRAPKRPVIELAEEAGEVEEAAPDFALELGEAEEAPQEAGEQADGPADEVQPLDLTGMQAGDDVAEEAFDEDDVDGIVDPLAGHRSLEEADSGDTLDLTTEVEEQAGNDDVAGSAGGDESAPSAPEASETAEAPETTEAHDTGEAEDAPVPKRRGLLGDAEAGSGTGAGGGVAGSTLFERMANLSRGTHSQADEDKSEEDKEDDEEDEGSALSIPRFLGRQNNQ